jgi:hypothetical protein
MSPNTCYPCLRSKHSPFIRGRNQQHNIRTVPAGSFENCTSHFCDIPVIVQTKNLHVIKFAGQGQKEITEYGTEEFERVAGHIVLPGLEFENEKTFREIQKKCMQASRDGLIDQDRKWLGALYVEQVRSHYMANVSIRWIDEILKHGLFAEEEIHTQDFIGEYAGVVKRRKRFDWKKNDYRFVYPTSFLYFAKHVIDGNDKGNEIRYANHSDDPNCEALSVFCDDLFHIILRAVRDISAHSQITYNYRDGYWKSRRRVPNVTEK